MFDPIVSEAVFTGAKAAVMAGMVTIACYHLLSAIGRSKYFPVFMAVVALSFLLSPLVLLIPQGLNVRNILSRLIGYEFVLLYIAAVLAIYHFSGVELFPQILLRRFTPGLLTMAVPAFAVLYLLPDFSAAFLFLRDRALILENPAGVALSSVLGLIPPALFFILLRRRIAAAALGDYLGVPQSLLFLAVLKLVLGGTRGVAEYSLIPSVQALVMKFVHDVVHHTFTILLVPDHPLLRTTVWNFIGFFFGSNFGLIVAFVLLLTPPLMFVKRILLEPLPAGGKTWTGAERRLFWSGIRSGRRKAALGAGLFVIAILSVWFIGGGEQAVQIYVPRPKPVVEDKGMVMIPLKDPTMDLRNGKIHKFSLSLDKGEAVTLIVVSRSDKALAVCLDACEICPPEGYGQTGDTVVCLYCATPITTDTLGKPGGCNPIPIKAEISDVDIRIKVDEIRDKWAQVKTGKTRDVVP